MTTTGGQGGDDNTSVGGAGGTGFTGNAGGNAAGGAAGGGGGGAGGGNGGDGSNAAGGLGGTAINPNGQGGANGDFDESNGGGGGGGGFNGLTAANITITAPVSGGNGGNGGSGDPNFGGAGGGGGAGGYGAVVTGSGADTNSSTIGGGAGGIGGDGVVGPDDFGGGGGGGGDGGVGVLFTGSRARFTNLGTGAITGGNGGGGGGGGYGAVLGGAGGAGGDGGTGVEFTATNASFTNSGTVTGGNGGGGGGGGGSSPSGGFPGNGGAGGDGGTGVEFTATGASFTNSGTVTGGNGGGGGGGGRSPSGSSGNGGADGAGGDGIVGAGLAITNRGTISGGLGGDGVTLADAIDFTGGNNTLSLAGKWALNGNLAVDNGSVLDFNQSVAATVSNVITGNGSVAVDNHNSGVTLTLTGSNTYTGGTTVNRGTLAVSADDNLGDSSGPLSFGGGTLEFLSSFTTSRAITLNHGGGTFDTDGNNVALAGLISGVGGLTKVGLGTLTLSNANGVNTYSGGTWLDGGALDVATLGAVGAKSIIFGASGETLKIDNPALSTTNTFGNTVANFAAGDVIDLTGLVFAKGATASYNAHTDILSVTSSGVTDTLTLAQPGGVNFVVSADGGTGTEVTLIGVHQHFGPV